MATAREYAEVLTFNRQDVHDALMVQSTIYYDGILKFSDKTIITKIATVTGSVATFIKKSKVLGIISTISALLDVWPVMLAAYDKRSGWLDA
ncbi:phosphoribosylaminoimidazole (AIR) synthetase [Paenibacillus amylolyticus]|uniref:Phosphoribosylaminoimidazole (AIR) synthetase n=1 Tax=Paenibacillus amylolyticus TaxID=1451 RepID=A0AAP5H3G7_PAEAM|nr:hypothetical protein [Paenibacillus amylolyticus]MDR6725618.1 phosphoribosylaminoimidazole (AIR) synthetase [Paenibacillus amylolyticus]